MRLDALLEGIEVVSTNLESSYDVRVKKVTHKVSEAEGAVLVLVDGVICEEELKKSNAKLIISESEICKDLPYVEVKNAREAYAITAKHIHNDACDRLNIILVSGTNGKSSTTNYIYQLLNLCNIKTAEIGTSGCHFEDYVFGSGMTTPDPDMLHGLFEIFLALGAEVVVMEASAHALELYKLAGIVASVGVFTNLSRDHFDFFENMERYKWAKYKLFTYSRFACINVDDESGNDFSKSVLQPFITYAINGEADLKAENVEERGNLSFDLIENGKSYEVITKLYGAFNVYNLLAAFSAAKVFGIDVETCVKHASEIKPLKGRFQIIEASGKGKVIIDYAHTPKAMENAIGAARKITKGRVISVFGCGGDRDREKRPLMGKTAVSLSDLTIITSDNPRYEDPEQIICEVERGERSVNGKYLTVTGRKCAIDFALFEMKSEDTVIILGKGAEEYNEVKGEKIFYNDEKTVEEILKKS